MTDQLFTTVFASGLRGKVGSVRHNRSDLRASFLGLAALLSLAQGSVAFAATAPALGANAPFGLVSSTLTNTAGGTTIQGNVCYTSGPAVMPSISGTTTVPCAPANGIDQNTALANINGQACTSLGAAVALNTIDVGSGPGIFTPGCYSTTGAMSVAAGSVTLNGSGIYIFRSAGVINTAAGTSVVMSGGACAADVFWAPSQAVTLGANTSLVGNIISAAGVTMGNLATLTGRLLAFGGTVTTDGSTVTAPTCTPFAGNPNPNPIPNPTISSTAIPTLSEWTLILLAGLMAIGGVVALRKKE